MSLKKMLGFDLMGWNKGPLVLACPLCGTGIEHRSEFENQEMSCPACKGVMTMQRPSDHEIALAEVLAKRQKGGNGGAIFCFIAGVVLLLAVWPLGIVMFGIGLVLLAVGGRR